MRPTSRDDRVCPHQQGFGLVGVLLALCIVGLLYLGLTSLQTGAQETKVTIQEVQVASKKTACELNRRALERAILTWQVTHPNQPVDLNKIMSDNASPGCPEGGKLRLRGNHVECSIH